MKTTIKWYNSAFELPGKDCGPILGSDQFGVLHEVEWSDEFEVFFSDVSDCEWSQMEMPLWGECPTEELMAEIAKIRPSSKPTLF